MTKFFDRVAFVTSTSGTGTIDYGSPINASFFTPTEAGMADGDQVTLLIIDGTDVEVVESTFDADYDTFTRDVVRHSRIAGVAGTTKLTLSGNAVVRIVQAAGDISAILAALAALGNASTKNVGTSAGTVAAGDDSRITGAAQKASNLSDLANAGTARTNLGVAIGSNVQAWDADLDALAALAATAGMLARTGAGAFAVRTLAVGTGLSISNADGASGAPTISVDYGKQSMWIPAGAITPRITNGCAPLATIEKSSNKNLINSLDFDTSTQEFAQFEVRMPKSWNEGTVTFIPVWSHASTTTNFGVVWGLDAVAVSDDDAQDAAFGTAQTSTDTGGTTDDCYQGPESSAITIAGTPAAGDLVMFRIHRDPANGSDTMAIDARLEGILILYTIDTLKDD